MSWNDSNADVVFPRLCIQCSILLFFLSHYSVIVGFVVFVLLLVLIIFWYVAMNIDMRFLWLRTRFDTISLWTELSSKSQGSLMNRARLVADWKVTCNWLLWLVLGAVFIRLSGDVLLFWFILARLKLDKKKDIGSIDFDTWNEFTCTRDFSGDVIKRTYPTLNHKFPTPLLSVTWLISQQPRYANIIW